MRILLVEDDSAEAEIVKESLREVDPRLQLCVVEDGVDALAYLRKEGEFCQATTPDIVLLDLNLPRKDGRAVLAEIKKDRYLRQIPVIVLSNSDSVEDIDGVYRHNGNSYVVKPDDMRGMHQFVEALKGFWGMQVRFSKARDPSRPKTGWYFQKPPV